MSNMANEIAARMAADGIRQDDTVVGTGAERVPAQEPGGVPGNAGANVPPPAGASNTDTGTQGGPPDSIPYARFKEVNDRLSSLRGYEELSQYGYDADSLRRLASFEQQYQADPIGVWRSMAVNLDLPQEVLTAINNFADAGQPPRAEGQTDGTDPATAPAVPAEVQKRLDYVDRIMQREEQEQREEALDRVVAAWDEMDNREGVTTPKRTQLTYIAAMASRTSDGRAVYSTVEGLAQAARSARMEDRDTDLGALVQPGNANRGAPPVLPGSLPTPAGPVKFTNLREASQAAEADLLAGKLSPLTE
jgi:hypothetical protein